MSLLSITNLSVAIHRFNILQGVTLSVDAGEIVAVASPSCTLTVLSTSNAITGAAS